MAPGWVGFGFGVKWKRLVDSRLRSIWQRNSRWSDEAPRFRELSDFSSSRHSLREFGGSTGMEGVRQFQAETEKARRRQAEMEGVCRLQLAEC